MLQKKVCMLGSFSVGKSSLVRRFIESIFSEQYHTSIGVKVDKRVVRAEGRDVTLVLWDLYGEDEFQKMRWSYLRGAAGYLLVADGTRCNTLEKAFQLEQRIREEFGEIPFILVINKADLVQDWELDPAMESQLTARNWTILRSSAKTGENVDEAFLQLTRKMLP